MNTQHLRERIAPMYFRESCAHTPRPAHLRLRGGKFVGIGVGMHPERGSLLLSLSPVVSGEALADYLEGPEFVVQCEYKRHATIMLNLKALPLVEVWTPEEWLHGTPFMDLLSEYLYVSEAAHALRRAAMGDEIHLDETDERVGAYIYRRALDVSSEPSGVVRALCDQRDHLKGQLRRSGVFLTRAERRDLEAEFRRVKRHLQEAYEALQG